MVKVKNPEELKALSAKYKKTYYEKHKEECKRKSRDKYHNMSDEEKKEYKKKCVIRIKQRYKNDKEYRDNILKYKKKKYYIYRSKINKMTCIRCKFSIYGVCYNDLSPMYGKSTEEMFNCCRKR